MKSLTISNSPTTRITVCIHDPDGYSTTRAVDISTEVFDGHDDKWLEPRVTRLALEPTDIAAIGAFLQKFA